ncbi:hypothetical protein PCANC_22769 [Puccinia coronata f. sp. avenae]|uniref:Uncharacterized protein n=1 Tax=Puccinia coronata f. sp. avenae TaxID=200324 RepID=A0A2N5SA00_9BASI|nr:hypothetical protein PCANC_22769 [Puccinia coronata f. sp. avenae]
MFNRPLQPRMRNSQTKMFTRTSPLSFARSHPYNLTAGIDRSNTAGRAVLEQPCSIGDWTGTVRPKPVPAGRTGLPDQFPAGVTGPSRKPIGHGCSSTARTAVFDQSMAAVLVTRCRRLLLEHDTTYKYGNQV